MNIRKIIKEELDPFDWVNAVKPFQLPQEWGATYSVVTSNFGQTEMLLTHFRENGYNWFRGRELLDDKKNISRLLSESDGVRFYITGRDHIDGWDRAGHNSRPELDEVIFNP